MKRFAVLALPFALAGAAGVAGLGCFHLVSPVRAAQDVSFDNVSTRFEGGSLGIPHIEITGSSLSKADLQALVEGSWGLPTVDALSKFDATSIAIPEIRFEITAPVPGQAAPITETLIYRDMRIEEIKGGKAGRVSLGGMSSEVQSPRSLNTSIGKVLITDYDFAALARVVYAAAQPGEAPRQISGPSTLQDWRSTDANGAEVVIGRVSVGAVRARPLVTPLAEFIPTLKQALASDKTLSAQAAAKLLSSLADFYDAIGFDGMSASDITIKVPDPSFKNASVQTLKLGSFVNSRIAEWSIEGLEVNAAGGHVKLGRAALLGMDLKPLLSSMSTITQGGELNEDAMKRLDWRNAIPHLDGVEVSALDVDIPQGSPPQNFKLGGYEIKLGNYVGSIPTSLQSQLDHFAADPTSLKGQGAELQQLGYRNVDLSAGTDVVWNESSKSLNVNDISAKGAEMGSVNLKATLGNVPRELFAGSPAQMQVAGLGITVGEASLRLENTGLLDRIIARFAAAQKTTPDKLRAQWGTQAALGIPQLLGGSDSAKALGNAVASFLAKPKTLFVSIKAKDANGLGITDVMSGGGPNPASILDKLEVKALANQ